MGGDGAETPPAGDDAELPSVLTGVDEQQALPETGARLEAGLARVDIRPLAVTEPVTVRAELAADRSLSVTMDPPLGMEVPALVTLPLPPGAEAGEDPTTWPVALLESEGVEPLVLQPEAVGERTFSVLVPHFSKVTPMQQAAALAKAGGAAPSMGAPYMPAVVDVKVSLPENLLPEAEVTYVTLTISARARTTVNNGVPVLEDGKVTPDWAKFRHLKVRLFDSKTEMKVNFLPLGEGEIWNGQPLTITIPTQSGWRQMRSAFLRLEDESGRLLVVRSIALPNGKYWKQAQCTELGVFDDFVVNYLWDPRSTGHPDTNYAGEAPAKGLIPSRVLDACDALTFAYTSLKSPRWFNDPGNAPSLPMDVWLQPWQENEAGNVRNWISLRTSAGTFDEFRRDAAHEMAHRFQHAYSIGYSGGWFHDVSAEYLANRIYGPDEVLAPFVGLVPQWVNVGLLNGQDVELYSGSSFLAYLSATYDINVARLWVEGASGLRNLQSWQTYIDSLLRGRTNGVGLTKAWADFGKLYLVDHSEWGDWTGVASEPAFYPGAIMELSARKSFYATVTTDTPYLSAGGRIIRVGGVPSATVVYHVSDPNQGRYARTADYWLSPSTTVDGRADPIELTGSRPLEATGSVRVGKTEGSYSEDGLIRITFVYSDWEGKSPVSSPLVIEAWALPEVAGVELDQATGRVTWEPSVVEGLADAKDTRLFAEYELVARQAGSPGAWVVVETVEPGKDEYEAVVTAAEITAARGEGDICVRVKDVFGNVSPEACPAAAASTFRLTRLEASSMSSEQYDAFLRGDLTPMPIVGCLSQPGDCYITIYTPRGGGAGALEIALVGPDREPVNGIIVGSSRQAEDPSVGVLNFAEVIGDEIRGQYAADVWQRQETTLRISGTSLSGFVRITGLTSEDDPNAVLVDGFPKATVTLQFDGVAVK